MVDRRRFLGVAGLAASAAAVGACGSDDGARVRGPDTSHPPEPVASSASVTYSFRGPHQAGVLAPLSAHGMMAAFDLRARNRDELADALSALTEASETVMSGRPFEALPPGFPPVDTGILGPDPGPTGTTVTIGLGASLFDERYGLGAARPTELQPMPRFANDQMVGPERSHGDLAVLISADTHDAVLHAIRQLRRATRGLLVPRWHQEGYNSLIHRQPRAGVAPVRNLMGFKDGTANLDPDDEVLMNELVWTGEDQPDWAEGGTYMAVRVIRMLAEFWDRTRLSEQEAVFGRRRDSGAPLGGSAETDVPDLSLAPDSHIARANPRTPGSERNLILRKGFSYSNGLDPTGQLDQGLLFVCFQRSLEDGFITVQRRLDGEALEEYVRPVGGGFFFVPPPPAAGQFLGQALLDHR